MTTTAQNFTMWSGDDKTITVTLSTDITGATINYAIAASVGSTALITKATGGSGIAITDAANGIFTIDLDPSDTSSKAGVYYHECQVTDTSSVVSTVFVGSVTINADLIIT